MRDEIRGAFTYATVSQYLTDDGPRGITLYTSRGDNLSGRAASAYWSLTQDDAMALGFKLIAEAARARGHDEAYQRQPDRKAA